MGKIFSLCPACNTCPMVEIDVHEVRIGEGGNRVRLALAEWNILVRAIRTGELGEVTHPEGEEATP